MKKRGTLARGQVIDGTYEVLFYIGEGAFGEVYRVQHARRQKPEPFSIRADGDGKVSG